MDQVAGVGSITDGDLCVYMLLCGVLTGVPRAAALLVTVRQPSTCTQS